MGEDHRYDHKDEAQALNFTQLDEAQRNASLRPIAIVRLEPGDFAERYGLAFRPDERRTSIAALLQTRPGQQYMLLRHLDAPDPGTEVLASEESLDPWYDLHEFLSAFDLDDDVVTWAVDRGPEVLHGD
jgi:hypothetical protein